MQIETFEIQQTNSEASELALEGASFEIIEKLGLDGQKSMVSSINGESQIVINPFRAMEEREMVVYKILCPEKADIKNYKVDSIPYKILEVAEKAMDTGLYHHLEVWYPREARIDDPVLVGIIQEKNFYDANDKSKFFTNDKFYLLARWGKCLPTFEQCEAMALDMAKNATMSYINKVMAYAKMKQEALKDSLDIMDFQKEVDFSRWGIQSKI